MTTECAVRQWKHFMITRMAFQVTHLFSLHACLQLSFMMVSGLFLSVYSSVSNYCILTRFLHAHTSNANVNFNSQSSRSTKQPLHQGNDLCNGHLALEQSNAINSTNIRIRLIFATGKCRSGPLLQGPKCCRTEKH